MQTLSGVNLIFSGSLPRPKPRGVKVVLQFDPGYPLGCNVHLSCGPPLPTPHQPFSEWNEWPKHANKPTSIATARGAQLWGKLAPPRRKKTRTWIAYVSPSQNCTQSRVIAQIKACCHVLARQLLGTQLTTALITETPSSTPQRRCAQVNPLINS